MKNSGRNSRELPQAAAHRRGVRRSMKGALGAVVALLAVGLFAPPASAHANIVTATPACPSGASYTITWTIANDINFTETATVTATSAAGGLATVAPHKVHIALTPVGTPPSAYKTSHVTQTLPATTTGIVTITVVGKWSDGVTQTATGTITLPPSGCSAPNVGVVKSVSTGLANNNVGAGSATPVVYTLAVKNNGVLPTTSGVTVTDAIPAGTTYVANSAKCPSGTNGAGQPTCTATEASGTVTFTLGTPIAGGATYDLTFAVTADASDPPGTIPNDAHFTGPGCFDETGCTTNTVTITVTNPAITVVKSANTSAVTAGQAAPVTYTLLVSNPSTQTSPSTTQSGVVVSDVVPAGLTYVSASCGALNAGTTPSCSSAYDASTRTVTFHLGAGIAVGASYPLTFAATVNAGVTASIVNGADYTGPGCTIAAPGCATNTVTITVTPPTAPAKSTTTTTTVPAPPVPKPTASTPTPAPATKAISGASTVHTGEPWAGSTPYVLAVAALGLSLLGLGGARRRRATRAPSA